MAHSPPAAFSESPSDGPMCAFESGTHLLLLNELQCETLAMRLQATQLGLQPGLLGGSPILGCCLCITASPG